MRKIVVLGHTYMWNYRAVRDIYCRSKLTMRPQLDSGAAAPVSIADRLVTIG